MTDGRLDSGYYDLLASEARLASFIAIARGDAPASHWFKLGRPLTPVGRGSALISWSGSMFEYLMPELVMEAPSGSLLDQTNRLVIERQIRYGQEHSIPWGISESAYNLRDVGFTYQYSNFGISGLGLKRGLSEDLVVAPYATALAAMVEPRAAMRNFERLTSMGAAGRYGFYEALDFTPAHLPDGEKFAIVRAFMAHHQGMTIVALANVLKENVFRARFHSEPAVQATELLLQERTPRTVAVARPRAEEVHAPLHVRDFVLPVLRRFTSPHHPIPRTHLLSNGRYSVMMTAAGSGYSRWQDRNVTRWREDVARDCWGTYLLLRDAQTGEVWSAGYQPTGVDAETYEAIFSEDRVEIHRRDAHYATLMQVVVSPEDDAEIRQVSITNLSLKPREVEVTSFAELALAPAATDTAHPAFSKLFIQTEFVPGIDALLASRRPRESEEETMWVAHVTAVEGETVGAVQYETDRARFLGRGRDIRNPSSMEDGRPLSNTTGSVLDPIVEPAAPAPPRPGSDRADPRRHDRRGHARQGSRARGQVSRARDIRAHHHARLDPGADPAPSPRDYRRRGAPLSAGREPDSLQRPEPAGARGSHRPQPKGGLGAVAPRHLRRRADRSRAHRSPRRPGHRASASPRARVLAFEGVGGRPRDFQRAGDVLRPGPARRSGTPDPDAAARGRRR